MKFSARTGWATRENALTLALERLKKSGVEALDLTESNPTRCGFRYADPSLLDSLASPENLVYEPDPRGLQTARFAVASYYREKGIALEPERIFLTAGTSEAYAFLFRLLADPGEKVAAPSPSYPLFDFLSDLSDLTVERYALKGSPFRIDAASLDFAAAERPRAFIAVNPNNPTGNFCTKEEISALARAARESQGAIIADEVFHDFAWDSKGRPSFAACDEALTFTLGGVSKTLGLPQMKLAWIAVSGPPAARDEAVARLEVIADTFLSVGTPPQRALPGWLSRRAAVRGEILSRVVENRARFAEALAGTAAEVLDAEGGWYAVARLPQGESDEAFVLRLLGQKGVLAHPGFFYDFDDDRHLVVSLLPPPAVFGEAASRLRAML